jgi:predicted RNA polymerase sigma factor
MIEEAGELLTAASRSKKPGRFQPEAAVQSAHAQRAVSGRTHWQAIALLLRVEPVEHDGTTWYRVTSPAIIR